MKEYVDKAVVYNKTATIVNHLTSFLAYAKLEEKEWAKLNAILTELLQLKFWIYDTSPAQVLEIPYQLGQKYYVKAATCSCGGYKEKGKFFPGEWDCEGCYEQCDKEFVVKEKTFCSIDEMLWMKDYEGKTFWLHSKDVQI